MKMIPSKIFLMGSHLSDNIFETGVKFNIVGKYNHSSFASLSTPPLPEDSELTYIAKSLDKDKKFFSIFLKSNPDLLYIDFLSELLDIFVSPNGSSCTLIKSQVIESEHSNNIYSTLSKERWPMWCKGIRRLFNLISERCYLGFVFINRVKLTDNGSDYVIRLNSLLEQMYVYVESVFPGKVIFISFPDNFVTLNKQGDNTFSYAKNYTAKVNQLISENITTMITEPVIAALLRTTNNDVDFQYGKLLIEEGVIKLGPFPSVTFNAETIWDSKHENRSWHWRLNWFSFIPYIISYHAKTKNNTALDLVKKLVVTWINYNISRKEYNPHHEFIWHDHGTALRLEQFIIFFFYIKNNAPDWCEDNSSFLHILTKSFYIHGQCLEEENFYSKHTNHGLEQSRVLLLLSQTIKDQPLSNRWRDISIKRISSELEYCFTAEGVHVENSPGYHIFVFKVFINMLSEYSPSVLGDLCDKFFLYSEKSLEFIARVLRPDAQLPILGDTEQISTTDGYSNMFGKTLAYSYFKYATSKGRNGLKPNKINKVYPKSGYAIFRDRWHCADDYKNTIHILVKAGCLSQYHHQQDEGNILLHAYGVDWLIDSGLYNYNQKDPIRRYMRSRYAHNVPVISMSKYAEEFEHRVNNWCISDFSEDDENPYVSMNINVLKSIEIDSLKQTQDDIFHNRTVSYSRELKTLTVEDNISLPSKASRNIDFLWHIPKDKRIYISNSNILIKDDSGISLSLKIVSKDPSRVSLLKGDEDKKFKSFTSIKANTYEESKVIVISFKPELSLNSSFIFSFGN